MCICACVLPNWTRSCIWSNMSCLNGRMRGRTDNHTILITIRHGADTAGGGHVSGHWYGHCYEYLSCVYGHVHVYGVYVHEHMCMRIGMYVYACGHVCKAGGLADCTALQAYVSVFPPHQQYRLQDHRGRHSLGCSHRG